MNDILGIDIGYGYTKTFKMLTGRKKFSTLVAAAVGNNSFGVDRQKISVNDETFLVGDDAETEPGWTIDTRTSDFVGSNAWLSVIGKALIINHIDPGDMNGMKLVFGLPPGLYKATEVKRLTDLIKKTRINYDHQGYDFSGTELQMIPQGAGIYFTYLQSLGNAPAERKKTIAVVDIGHYTVDTVLFSDGKYINNITGSTPLGVSILLDRVRTEFSQAHGKYINNEAALKLLSEGRVSIFQQEYTLDETGEWMKAYALQVSSLIDSFFDGLEKVSADLGIVAGGGISLVQNHLRVKHRVLVMPNPDMANVVGYWYYGSTTREGALMQKRICFTLDTEKDKDALTVLEEIPQCLRGSFIKVAITMDIDTQRDEEILKMYPDFLSNPMRYKIVKRLLKQQGNQIQEQGSEIGEQNSTESQLWAPPVIEVPQG